MALRFLFSLLLLGSMGACASSNISETMPSLPKAFKASEEEPVKISRNSLKPQTLNPGECGLFLWNKTDPSQFIFFVKAGESTAKFYLEGQTETLQLLSTKGDIFGQFLTEQNYQTATKLNIALSFRPGKIMQEGQRIEQGRLQYLSREGWLNVQPVVGVRACRASQSENASSVILNTP